MIMDKAQFKEMLEYYQAHKGEAFILNLNIVKLLDVSSDDELGTVLIVYDDTQKGPIRLDFFETHLTQLKGSIEDEDYTNIMFWLDTNFAQYMRTHEYETQSGL